MNTRARGYTIVELLVAVTLGLLILAGVLQVFINSKQGYQVQQSVGRAQENTRFAVEYLSRYILVADFWSGVDAGAPHGGLKYIASGTPSSGTTCASNLAVNNWVVSLNDGIHGYAGASSASSLTDPPKSCVGSNYVPNSDVLVVRFANPDAFTQTQCLTLSGTSSACPNGSPATAGIGGYWVRSQVGARADIFNSGSTTSVNAAIADLPGEYSDGVLNYQYQTVVFFLQNVDNGEGAVPTLTMLSVNGSSMVQQPIVDGVEMLKFEYGVDTNSDLSVDQYLPAGSVTNWSQVLSVRFSMIVRGDTLDNYTDSQSYQMTDTFCYGPSTSSSCSGASYAGSTSYQRRLIVREVQLRNRVR
ncbi:MAG: PilW family protein [Nevskia sp.]|nr:PilW family protein [Nevskia sp.]